MEIFLPNSANLQNIQNFFRRLSTEDAGILRFSMHNRWVAVHPVVLAMAAALGARVRHAGGTVQGEPQAVSTLPYLIRMGLFQFLGIDPGRTIVEHDESGRFIPITQIRNTTELKTAIANLIPLLHAPPEVADPIRYVFSEMVRNVIEHANSEVGAFVCAQYYKDSGKISVGIADCGVGILKSMQRSHRVESNSDSIMLALQPGITGTTSRIGGNEFNAGAGLFFTKSIATLSRNYFMIYSGDNAFRLLKSRKTEPPTLSADPARDRHNIFELPHWQGTVVGIDLNVSGGLPFSDLLSKIREAYSIDVKKKKNYASKIRFTK
jgi:anti-sigma regulatory factor (Ser/Thr protein kinase)